MLKHRLLRNGLIVVLVLCGCELLAFALARLLIVRAPLLHADAIVVLSGSSVSEERVRWAAELYERRVAPIIILTNDNQQAGWSNELQRNPFFFETSRDELQRLGVPKHAIEVLLEPVSGTHDEALLLKSYCQSRNFASILIVTSPYHSRRALWTFNRTFGPAGLRVGINPVWVDAQSVATWWLHLAGWKTVPLEYMKLIYYRIYF